MLMPATNISKLHSYNPMQTILAKYHFY